jgi:N-acetylglucosaminyldiphosphoundecaprenol N-acetyl-beta-D-mannosaminyltransferase
MVYGRTDNKQTACEGAAPSIGWPPRHDLLGVLISQTNYDEVVKCVLDAARRGRPTLVTAADARSIILTSKDPDLRRQMRDFDLITPDGQAVRLALNYLYKFGLRERVCGPELLPRICKAAAEADVGVYLYGSAPTTVTRLRDALVQLCPGLRVVGCEPGIFRKPTLEEETELIERMQRSQAGIIFIGLGYPRQERFAHAHCDALSAVQVCVGAAFDFSAGTKSRAPVWMQDHALEWLYRLIQEPRRMYRRYLISAPNFVFKVLLQGLGLRYRRAAGS